MKLFILGYLLPLIISIVFIFKISTTSEINQVLFKKKIKTEPVSKNFIDNFTGNSTAYQRWFLESGAQNDIIFLLGSSELNLNNVATPYNFINKHFTTKLNAVGHAGNQSFSIYSQLLANEEKLKNAPIVIIISPIWFHSDYADGTNPELFLEFNTEYFLDKIYNNDSIEYFKEYEMQKIAIYNKSYASPPLCFKIMGNTALANENIAKKIIFTPVVFTDKLLLNFKTQNIKLFNKTQFVRNKIYTDSLYINWDSLLISSKQTFLNSITNNKWCINNDYYSKYTKGEHSELRIRDINSIKELSDFNMLMKLLKAKNVNASFVIQPMNPYCYTNLKELDPVVDSIKNTIKRANFPLLNMWVTDTSKYDKGILNDIMHLSEYGWYKVDKFIVDTYHLNKLN